MTPRGLRTYRARIVPALLACATGAVVIALAVLWPDTAPRATSFDNRLRLATANLYYDNPLPRHAGRALTEIGADLLILLEWSGDNADLSGLKDAGLVVVAEGEQRGSAGVAVLARPGLVRDVAVLPPPVAGACASELATIRVELGGAVFNIIGAHAPAPLHRCGAGPSPTLEVLASWIEEGRANRRVGAAEPDRPTVVAGDLNSFWFWRGMRALRAAGLKDSYRETRWRLGPTWPVGRWIPPFARIDYVLVPNPFTVFDSWAVSLPGSDHRVVVTEFSPR